MGEAEVSLDALDSLVSLGNKEEGVGCHRPQNHPLMNQMQPMQPPPSSLSVTLFCAAPLPTTVGLPAQTPGENTSRQGTKYAKEESCMSAESGESNSSTLRPLRLGVKHSLPVRVLPCLKRGDRLTRFIVRCAPGFTWRWGWKSGYELEQRSFWRLLWPILRDEGFDILHVQDPLLADLCRRYRSAGKLKTKEILAHGTEESVAFLAKFDYVQHLAPWHLEQTLEKLGEERC